jgi:hypothetical protein
MQSVVAEISSWQETATMLEYVIQIFVLFFFFLVLSLKLVSPTIGFNHLG